MTRDYHTFTFGSAHPDAIYSTGESVLFMRRKIGIADTNDSDGQPILADECYVVTQGGETHVMTWGDE